MSRRRPDDEDDDAGEGIQPGRPQPRRSAPPPRDEDDDERPRRRPVRDEDEEDDRPRRRPPGDERPRQRNGFALTGYYMGFLGLIAILGSIAFFVYLARTPVAPGDIQSRANLVGLVLIVCFYGIGGLSGLLAIIFGGVGLAKAPSRGSGTGHSVVGIVLGALEILGLIVVTVFFAALIRR